jgi:hypothetical protein
MNGSPVLDLRMGTTEITLLEGERCEAEGGEQIKIAPTGTMRRSEVSLLNPKFSCQSRRLINFLAGFR